MHLLAKKKNSGRTRQASETISFPATVIYVLEVLSIFCGAFAPAKTEMEGQIAIIAGGSQGLGRELAELMVLQGADVIILARNFERLTKVKDELWSHRIREDQSIEVQSIDLAKSKEVENFVDGLKAIPSYVFLCAGGCVDEIGLFIEVSSTQLQSCFQQNYLASALLAHALMRLWINQAKGKIEKRHLVFINSTASFAAIPGYAAYIPTKTALRALADTLRQEVMIYEPIVDIRVHSAFPNTILTESFAKEQAKKPEICKQLEESEDLTGALTPKVAARNIVSGVEKGHFAITMDFETRLLLNNMRGPTPPQLAIWDWILTIIGSLVWPFYRRMFDRKTRKYGVDRLKEHIK